MAKKHKIPLRVCVGCMENKPKKELLRIVRSPEGLVEVDDTGKKSGRGVYICRNVECLQKARKGKRLEKRLRASISPIIYEEINKYTENMNI